MAIPMKWCLAACALLASFHASSAPVQAVQQAPVFRAGVDLVTVDVAVVDQAGQPITGLLPRHFSVVANHRSRRILSADYVSSTTGTAGGSRLALTPSLAGLPRPTTNTPPSGRTFLFVVDVDETAMGTGRAAIQAIGNYLDHLAPDDRVGLVSLPYGSPRVDLTTNREVVRSAAALIVGASTRNQDEPMTVGEAAAIERHDCPTLLEYLHRIGRLAVRDDRVDCRGDDDLLKWVPAATAVMDIERRHSRDLFDALRALATAMAPIEGPKGLVLVSQGLVHDRETASELQRFAEAAEKARVTLYALNVDAPLADSASKYPLTAAHLLDHDELLNGMAALAIAGRGSVFVLSGSPVNALRRIDAEMSGYYLLSFERDPADRDGQRGKIEVAVDWPGATVRARAEFASGAPASRPAPPLDPKAAIIELLRWPVPTSDMAVDLDTYSAPSLESPDAIRTVVAASLASNAGTIAATGYEVLDTTGRVVDQFIGGGAGFVPTQAVGGRRLSLHALSLKSGRYRIKFAAIDADGRRGSVEHVFEIGVPAAGALRLGAIVLGEVTPEGFLPSPASAIGGDRLPLRVEVQAASAAAFSGATVTLELGRAVGGPPLATSQLSWVSSDDPRRRFASATLAIASLLPGDFVVTAVVRAADGSTARTMRAFTKK